SSTSYIYTLSLHDALPILYLCSIDKINNDTYDDIISLNIDEKLILLEYVNLTYNQFKLIIKYIKSAQLNFKKRYHKLTFSNLIRSEEHTSELQSRRDLVCR